MSVRFREPSSAARYRVQVTFSLTAFPRGRSVIPVLPRVAQLPDIVTTAGARLLASTFETHKRNKYMRKIILTSAALLAGLLTSSATVTVQGWWHLDNTQPIADSSGNGQAFGYAYSTAPATGGAVAAQLINNGAGGPLGSSGWTSTQCIQVGVGVGGKRQSSMWATGYNPPAQRLWHRNLGLPQDNGIAGGSGGWILLFRPIRWRGIARSMPRAATPLTLMPLFWDQHSDRRTRP